MITAKDIRNKRFEKAAFGYKQEEIDEFLAQLEGELNEMEEERTDVNNKIQILADKVREYMKDEEALKDALLGAQKQGHRVIAEANEKAEAIIAEAKAKADAMVEEATKQHEADMEKNRLEIEREKEAAVKEIKEDIASIAVDIAGKVIEKDLTEKDHERLLEEFIESSGEEK